MAVAMMHVREMLVVMDQRLMPVPVTVRRAGRSRLVMLVLMMRVVDMLMLMLYRFVQRVHGGVVRSGAAKRPAP